MSTNSRRLRIVAVNVIHRGTLLGTVDLEFSGIRLRCAVIHGPHGPFVGLPRSARLGRDGRQLRGSDGKLEFGSLIEWADPELAQRFQDAVLDLLEHNHPALLHIEAAPEQLALPSAREPLPARTTSTPRRPYARQRPPVPPNGTAPPLPDDGLDDLWREGEQP